MTAETITREAVAKAIIDGLEDATTGFLSDPGIWHLDDDLTDVGIDGHCDMLAAADAVLALVDLPTRLAAARAEGRASGYREGGEEAASAALRRRDAIPHGHSPYDTGRRMGLEDAAREARAIAPAPAEAPTPLAEALADLRRDMDAMPAGRREMLEREIAAADAARMGKPAEASAPVAGGGWPAITENEAKGIEYALMRDDDDYEHTKTVVAALVRDKCAARIAALEAEKAELLKALKPFADEADEWDGEGERAGDGDPVFIGPDDVMETGKAQFAVGDMRRARALLQGQGGADAG
jgi:hypothetical protein